jgi:two-component sensor histidine kinase
MPKASCAGAKVFFEGSGRSAELVAGFDWAATPLGPPSAWPPELTATVQLILESRFPAAVIWGPEFTTIYNDAFRPILGAKPEAMGRPFSEIWAEAWDEIGPIAAKAYGGEATYIEDFPLVIDRFGRAEQAWFTFCYSPLRLADGTVAGMLDTVVETTATVKAKAQLEVLNRELGHRLMNTLAIIQAIARQSLKGVTEREAVEAFIGRIVALAGAHDVLLGRDWRAAPFRDVARAALGPIDGLKQISLEGPDLIIGPRGALALGLLLHELATNAAKYGALSCREGRVTLSWTRDEERVRMHWRERGGPPVNQPERMGFGTRLIDLGLSNASVVVRRYPTEGFEALVDAPVADLIAS